MTLWLVTSKPYQFSCQLFDAQGDNELLNRPLHDSELVQTQVGEHAFVNHLSVKPESLLPEETVINYELLLNDSDNTLTLTALKPELLYTGQTCPSFVIKPRLNKVLHGSCRKPHFDSGDGLAQIDRMFASEQGLSAQSRPSLLMMSGDQVYVDDVAGPTLNAIHQVIARLGLYTEQWENDDPAGQTMCNSLQLFEHPHSYYKRHLILPHDRVNKTLFDKMFGATKRPIFTSVNAKNHLVTLSEVLAMYFLVWSPTLWHLVDLEDTPDLVPEVLSLYQKEREVIKRFVEELEQVQRALAHIPTYMIFDDHDVTDDWNLTRGWEEAAYEHPFSKRIIGNALAGYYLCQGLGNGVANIAELSERILPCFTSEGVVEHDRLISELLDWDCWHYHLATNPKLVVLDTRTQRWRSESNAGKPSGLMDWESLTALQQELINEPAVIMVSPAPIYGVKLIEAVQRVFTFFGKPLAVDAENWMAHSGTANVMLNIFRHHKTPPHFVILSGDVHYSFVYDVTHRFRRNSSKIIQITSSGIKNKFPEAILNILERLNYYLYGRYSPLNWFTKRRRMKIHTRKPSASPNRTLYNGSGIGLVELSENAEQVSTSLITDKGEQVIFEAPKES